MRFTVRTEIGLESSTAIMFELIVAYRRLFGVKAVGKICEAILRRRGSPRIKVSVWRDAVCRYNTSESGCVKAF